MTRFRSRFACLAVLLIAGGCSESGVALNAPLDPDLVYAYVPLKRPFLWVVEADAGGVVLGDGIAVTAAHAENLVPRDKVIGVSTDYDLLFFRTERTRAALAIDTPHVGGRVVSYAHYDDDLYKAEGVVTSLDAPVKARCDSCVVQSSFAFDGNAGPGYSGGPVLDAETGKLIGIVFGYLDKPEGGRTIYAYPMSRVFEELKKVQGSTAAARLGSSR